MMVSTLITEMSSQEQEGTRSSLTLILKAKIRVTQFLVIFRQLSVFVRNVYRLLSIFIGVD